MPTCPDCGATGTDGETCAEIFDALLVKEFTDPSYGDVHFLTVACYMIQHHRYSDEGLRWIVPILRAYLEDNIGNAELRRRAAATTQNTTRTWKVMRAAGAAPLPGVAWTMTIADVWREETGAEHYGDLVRRWGRSVLADGFAQGRPLASFC